MSRTSTYALLRLPAVYLSFALALLFGTGIASAFDRLPGDPEWPNDTWSFYIDADSFDDYIDPQATLSLTESDYVWWVLYAASQWVVRGLADFEFDYQGTTSSNCYGSIADGNETNADGMSVVGSRPSCSTDCTDRGRMLPVELNGYGDFVEVDICMFSDGVTWDVESDLTDWDLIGSLTHEFGHAMGLDHTEDTTMHGGGFGTGNTIRRFLTGDDADGVRSIYGTRTLDEYLLPFSMSTNAIGNIFSKPGALNLPAAGAIALDGGSWYTLRATLNTSQNALFVDRTPYPANSGSSWSNYSLAVSSWLPPALAANDHASDQTISIVLPGDYTLYTGTCNGITSWTSTNLFASATSTTTGDICTSHSVGLAFDPGSDRWVLAYVGLYDNGSVNEGRQSEIMMRTSSDGRTWSAMTELQTGFHTIDAPSIACNDTDGCVLSFADSSTDTPRPRNVAFHVGSSLEGYVPVIDSSQTESANFVARTPAMGVTSSGSFVQLLFWASSYHDHANGRSSLYSRTSATLPLSYPGGWTSLGDQSSITPTIISHYQRSNVQIHIAE